MKKILIVTTGWGHSNIARAIKKAISRGYKTQLSILEVEPFSKVSYGLVYRFFPIFFRTVYGLSEVKVLRKLFNKFAQRSYKKTLQRLISKEKPNIIINTYFAFNSSLEFLLDKYNFRFINVLADPWTFSRILISERAENLIFDRYSWRKIRQLNPKAPRYLVGWFTEKKFYQAQKIKRESMRKNLHLDPHKFTLCITSGSEGTFNVFKILKTFFNPKYKIQILIMCGNNTGMLKAVRTLKAVSGKIKGPEIIGIPYTNEMEKYLRASDLVIGKAGPNTLFESVATLTPFFAISHISGQEDGNLGIIKKYKIGFVEERPTWAIKKIERIIENPQTLNKLTKNIKGLADYCQSADGRLLKLLKR
jgi:UDP-N-acetylglucosamine:LPS N-acetylglucosamine transferase